jgi:hypothetical protein
MTGGPGEGWKVFADGDEADDVPLWKVLAKIRSDNLDEGLNANAALLDRIRPAPSRYYNLALVISIVFGFLAVLFLIGLLISVRTGATDLFYFLTVAVVAAAVAPQLWRQAYQYGLSTPDRPWRCPTHLIPCLTLCWCTCRKWTARRPITAPGFAGSGFPQSQTVFRQAALFPVFRAWEGSGAGHALPDRNGASCRYLSPPRRCRQNADGGQTEA